MGKRSKNKRKQRRENLRGFYKKPTVAPVTVLTKEYRQYKNFSGQACTFYESQAWRELRYKVLKIQGPICNACGATAKSSGRPMHVDHIKPRSKFPELELDFNNLQVLCEECNLGKINKDETDWRVEAPQQTVATVVVKVTTPVKARKPVFYSLPDNFFDALNDNEPATPVPIKPKPIVQRWPYTQEDKDDFILELEDSGDACNTGGESP